jgi:hypothetical protein
MNVDSPPSSVRRVVGTFLYTVAGAILVVHGIGHAALAYAGSGLVSSVGMRVLFGALCAIALIGFLIAGLSLGGARPMERPWRGRSLAMLALVASVGAFAIAWIPEFWPGLLFDAVVAIILFSSSATASNTARRDRSVLRRISTIGAFT